MVTQETVCPGGCGGVLKPGDVWCPACRYAPCKQRVKEDPNWCWQWFGHIEHRMKCRRHIGHEGECHDHSDSDSNNISRLVSAKHTYERRDDGYLYPIGIKNNY